MSAPAMPLDFLALEADIVARLRARCPAARAVLTAEDLADVQARSQTTPALHVIYGGYRVLEASDTGRNARTEQTWVVVVALRAATQRATAASAPRVRAGELVGELLAALMGWRPAANMRPLTLANGPRPVFRDGCAYLPFAFTAAVPVHVPKTPEE